MQAKGSAGSLISQRLQTEKEKKALLFLLGKYMPSHIAFQVCQKLHKVDKSLVTQVHFDNLPCTKNDIATNTYTAINENLGTQFPKSLCSSTKLGLDLLQPVEAHQLQHYPALWAHMHRYNHMNLKLDSLKSIPTLEYSRYSCYHQD